MRNKVLRVIFPDRGVAASNSQANFPFQSTSVPESTSLAQTFSQLAVPVSGNSAAAVEASGRSGGAPLAGSSTEVFNTVSKNLDRLRAATESQITETQANTTALSTNTATKGASQTLSAVSSATGGLLGGLTALPLVSGLLSLFGGGSTTTAKQAPLTKYVPPPALTFGDAVQSGSDGGNLQHASYDRFGNPRTNFLEAPSVPDYSSLIASTASSTGGSANSVSGAQDKAAAPTETPLTTSGTVAASHVTVNIQALDSRSFLDRSQDIAQAVREAMLNMHSINDVVNDL